MGRSGGGVSSEGDIPTEVLLEQARAGDARAWSALAERHSHRVRLALLADGVGLEASRDLTQEAWALLWAKQRRGELTRLELPGLVIAQARFLGRDLRRRQLLAPDDGPGAEQASPAALPDRELITREALARVQRLLAARSERQQRVFRLAVEEQRPHADIARGEGLSLQRVRQIVHEVRAALRGALDGSEESP